MAIAVTTKTNQSLELRPLIAIDNVTAKLKDMGLIVAQQKTEKIILCGKQKLEEIDIETDGLKIESKKSIKYMGIYLGRNLNITTRIEKLAVEANKPLEMDYDKHRWTQGAIT